MSTQWGQQWELERSVNVNKVLAAVGTLRSVNINTVVVAVGTSEVCECQYSGGSSGNLRSVNINAVVVAVEN